MDKAKILRLCANIEKSLPDLCLTVFYKERDKLIEEAKEIAAEISEKPKSNADRIRQMTDEELAKFIDFVISCCSDGWRCNECPLKNAGGCNKEDVSIWLKQEVSEDAAD